MLNRAAEVLGLIPRGKALIQLQPRVVEHTAQRPDQDEGDPPDQVLSAGASASAEDTDLNATLSAPAARVQVEPSDDQQFINLLMIGDSDQAFASFPAEFESQIPDRWQGEIERESRGGNERRSGEYESP